MAISAAAQRLQQHHGSALPGVMGEGNGAGNAWQGWQRKGKLRGRWSLCTLCNKGWEWDAEIKKRQVFCRACGHAFPKPANAADPKLEYQRLELKNAKDSGDQKKADLILSLWPHLCKDGEGPNGKAGLDIKPIEEAASKARRAESKLSNTCWMVVQAKEKLEKLEAQLEEDKKAFGEAEQQLEEAKATHSQHIPVPPEAEAAPATQGDDAFAGMDPKDFELDGEVAKFLAENRSEEEVRAYETSLPNAKAGLEFVRKHHEDIQGARKVIAQLKKDQEGLVKTCKRRRAQASEAEAGTGGGNDAEPPSQGPGAAGPKDEEPEAKQAKGDGKSTRDAAEAMVASAKESVRKAIAKKVVDHRKTTKGPAPRRG